MCVPNFIAIHPIVIEDYICQPLGGESKSQGIIKVRLILWALKNICTKFNVNLPNSCFNYRFELKN